jgi:hypothetical protein
MSIFDAAQPMFLLVTTVGLAVAAYRWGNDSVTPAASRPDGRSVRDALKPE